MTLTATSILIAVTSAGAGGKGSQLGESQRPATEVGRAGNHGISGQGAHGLDVSLRSGEVDPADSEQHQGGNRGSAPQGSDPVAYWHHLAAKRLRLLGARERRIVRLLRRNRVLALAANRGRNRRGSYLGHPGSVRGAICSVFGAHCSEALRVAWCESRWNVHATNGQYWGLFQEGEYARARYGFAWSAWAQARSAYRYFLDAGWSPWTCRP